MMTLGYPDADDEVRVVTDQRHGHPLGRLQPVVTVADVRELQRAVEDVYVDELLQRWIVGLVRATRELPTVAIGASVRGSLALERVARAWALLNDRSYVTPDDVDALFLPVLGHRIVFTPGFLAESRSIGWDNALRRFRAECFERVPRPEPAWEPEVVGASPTPV
jgi:MoxR-like ATPase